MKNRSVLTALILSFLSTTAFASKETGQITGHVLDQDSQPLGFANVLLYAVADSSLVKAEYTDEDGSFELLNIGAGRYWLSVSYVGLPDYTSPVFDLATGQALVVTDIKLLSKGLELSAVTVTAKRPMIEVLPDKTVFNVEGSINATGSNAMELLRKAPGVVVDNNDNVLLSGKSGVRIYIDGKPTQLSMEDLAAYLKTLQSSDIATIEVITNPSAKWEAEGNAGIINIRMKKDKRMGGNGSVNLGYSVGRKQNYNTSFSGNYRNKSMNTFGSYNFSDGAWMNIFNLYREQYGSYFDQHNNNTNSHQSHNFKLGNDFFVNDKTTIGVLFNGYVSNHDRQSSSTTPIGQLGSGTVDSTLVASSNSHGMRSNYNFNLNYRFDDTKGKVWNMDADYGFFKNEGNDFQPNTYLSGDGGPGSVVLRQKTYSNSAPTKIDIATFKLDHERPLLNGQLSAGAKFSYVKTDNDFNFFKVLEGEPVVDMDRTNFFVYTEMVNAAYVNYARQMGKWGLQAGLRGELTHSEGDLTALKPVNDQNVKRDYFNLFPSGGLTFAPNDKHSLQLTYSRRLDRPSYQDLNPFEGRLDELTFEKGNPFLNPQYTNNLSINHTFLQRFNTSLSYSHTNDLIERLVDIDSRDSSASFITWENIAKQNNLSLNISAPIAINKWWNAYVNLNAYRTHNAADFGEGKTVDLTALAYNVYAQQTFTLPFDMSFELSGWYSSPAVWGGTFKMDDMWAVDAGLQKKLLKGKASLKLAVSDIFYTQNWSGTSRFGDLYMRANGKEDSRRLRLNFSYNFGNEQVKAARNRSTGLDDEKGRVKGE